MRQIDETQLPGVGMRHDFLTRDGTRIGVISHRSGRKELLVYGREDPDACSETVWLDGEDSHALAELLGGTTVGAHLQAVTQEVEGLAIDWVRVAGEAPPADSPLGSLASLPGQGAVVVAVQRGEQIHSAPGADFELRPGDIAVLVGTPDAVDGLAAHLRHEE